MIKTTLTSVAATALLLGTASAQDPISAVNQPELLDAPDLTVEISNVEEDAGKVYVALQTEEQFATNAGLYTKTVEAEDDEVEVTFEDVTPGQYAVAVFQDTDENSVLTLKKDRPAEPYGFSGDVTGAPEFTAASIAVGDDMETEVELKGKDEKKSRM